MAEFLIAPNIMTASTPASARDNESRAREAARADTDAGTPTPFAAVLKSRSEKNQAESGRETSAAAESPRATDTADTVAAADQAALLSLLGVDIPPAANPEQMALAPAITPAVSPAIVAQTDTLTLLQAAPAPTVTLAIPMAAPVTPASAIAPAPTFQAGEKPSADKNASGQSLEPSAGLAIERSTAPDKLAAEAAITATPARTGISSTSHDPNEGEFRAIIERATNNPAGFAMQTSATSAPTAPMPGLRMESSLGQAGWRDEIGQKLTWMASNHRQQAELILNPPQLGRIEVTLTLDGDRASVSFVSPHAAVRETLENAMTRLREVLAEAGVTLGQTHVGADSRHNQNAMHLKDDGSASGRMDGERQAETPGALSKGTAGRSVFGRGMVDIFA